ncbi:efflux RND transporter periplasmic adaptor subunit [Spongiibacter nanhainus]|uniref:Efflux RND transporter periplasmic adaptor subunit n=1 Tax=Spongiibacter nanhainus TaxID=2794344 RepID=A0A7T4R1B3_9GAMM|nr:efflux RND transporter periplasmic adaptor subunit [Spongiibacter nanhainus]QQD18598.1 efflux RND transporter periplasmic adaptor subunit [Spongiibacter nanhainus]
MTSFISRPRRALAAFTLLISASLMHPIFAVAETIPLSSEDQARLGIVSQPLVAADSSVGIRVPAIIIPSPESPSQLVARYDGVLLRWHQPGGAEVEAGELVATINSPALARVQEQWLAAVFEQANQQALLVKDRQLYADGIISRQRLAQTERAAQQASFNRDGWQGQLKQAGFDEQALKQLQSGQLQPGDYPLKASRSGELSREYVRVGDAVSANQPLASVTSSDTLWLHASISGALADGLALGQELQIAESNNTQAKLILVSKNRELSAPTQRVDILARYQHPVALRPGQRVSLILSSTRAGVKVPASAVTRTGAKAAVYVRGDDGFELRSPSLVALGEDYLATAGLQAGEEVAVQGTAQLKGMLLGLGGAE